MRRRVANWSLALAFVAFLYAFGSLVDSSQSKPEPIVVTITVECSHGESSIGPVTLKHGRIVGDTRVHRTGC